MNKDLTVGKPSQVLWQFCLPMFGSIIFQQLYNIADSLVAGKFIGENALAAVGNSYEITLIFIAFAFGCNIGCSVIVSRYFGAKEYDDMKTSVYTALIGSAVLCAVLMVFGLLGCRSLLELINTPAEILADSALYLDIYVLGLPFMFFYNIATGIFSALGDSKTPLYFLVFSSVLNIILDIVFIVPMHMGVAGAAWATILSQFLSAVFSTVVRLRNFPILHLRREDFHDLKGAAVLHLKTGFPMGFQMSVMCIGQLAMQAVVNSLGTAAVAGYTAASKADQLSVLVNNAMMTAISNYVAQNFGAGKKDRIRLGVRASLIQTEAFNILMCIGILLLRHPIVELFLSNPTAEIYHYSDAFLTIEAPFYFLLGLLAVYRTSIQSMQNGRAPFAACMIELVMRLAATVWLSRFLGYTAVCIASPLAWFGAVALLIPVYYRMMMKPVKTV